MKDSFSEQAKLYARYRPAYPPELFDFIIHHTEEKKKAWDCATGNGQTARELAKHFEQVCATDISSQQLGHAEQHSAITYSLQPAEQTNFADNSFNLVTVSQALHWFDFDRFYEEVNRVAKPGGWISVWMYALLKISPPIDKLIDEYHFETLGACWDKERQYVDNNYSTVPFPFDEIECPVFQISYAWDLAALEGYLNTWSALRKFIAANAYNPVSGLMERIRPYWTKEKMNIIFPVHMRMGKIDK